MGWMIAALVFPAFLVYVFTRVTYNPFIGLILTLALICASAYAGYTDTWPIIIIDACSITFGLWLSRKYVKQPAHRSV